MAFWDWLGRDPGPLFSDDDVRRAAELMLLAPRPLAADLERVLSPLGMGPAHHRVLHFVGSNPGLRVGDLLVVLKVTKQSLNRVLGQLVRKGYITVRPGGDRRERRLNLTATGERLARRLSDIQEHRIRLAFTAAGVIGAEGFNRVMVALCQGYAPR